MRTLVRIILWVLGIASVVCIALYYTLLEPWTVPVDDPQLAVSLLPTMAAGDAVLLSRSVSAQPGQLVRCSDPDAPGRFVIGRVLAKTGSNIQIKGGLATVDRRSPPSPTRCDTPTMSVRNPGTGEDIDLDCANEELGGGYHEMLRGKTVEKDTDITPLTGATFIISDNRVYHLDSRDFGVVNTSTCQHILFRLWSADGQKRMNLIW